MVKIIKVEDAPFHVATDGKRKYIDLISEETGAKDLHIAYAVYKPGLSQQYHYHPKECVWFVLSGRAKALLEDREYDLKPNMVVFIAPGEKHKMVSCSDQFKMIEVFSAPLESFEAGTGRKLS